METDIGLVIAIVGSAVAIVGVVVGMFLWLRGEANNDRRHFQDIQRDDRKELLQITRSLENTVKAIQDEMKDFHRQLIEVQRKVS